MRGIIRFLAAACIAATAIAPAAAGAADYPTRTIRLIIGYGPGGVADITARLVAEKMSEILGKQIIIDNRPGAGQIAAAEAVARAAPDGYTLLSLNNGNAISAALFKKLPFDTVKDFAPIAPFGFFGILFLVDNNSPFASVKDFIAKAKASPDTLSIGTTSVGSTQYLSAELLKSMTGTSFAVVPFSTTGQLLTALQRGDIQAAFESPATTLPFVRAKKLKALAVTTKERQKSFPDIPTVADSVPGYEVLTWNALAAPAKTPQAIIDKLNQVALKAAADPEVQRKFAALGVDTQNQTPDQVRALVVHDIAKWQAVIKAAKIPLR